MEARLEADRPAASVVVLVLAMALTLMLGAAIGFLMRPVAAIPAPPRFVVVTTQPSSDATACVRVAGHKGC